MFKRLRMLIFGCTHSNCGWPITLNKVCYRVCVDCGMERKYDFQRMKYVAFERGEQRQLRNPNYGDGVIL